MAGAKSKKRVREPGKRLSQIREAAIDLFYEKGYDGTSVSDIAAVLKIEKATLYHYMKSKDILLFQILSSFLGELIQELQKNTAETADRGMRLRTILMDQIKVFLQRRKEGVIFFREVKSLPEDLRHQVRDMEKRYLSLLSEKLAGRDSSMLPSLTPGFLSLTFLGLCNTLIDKLTPGVSQIDRSVREFVEFFIRGIQQSPIFGRSEDAQVKSPQRKPARKESVTISA